MKKVTLKHLSKRHKLPVSTLRELFVAKWLIDHKDKKVYKKKAKRLIHEFQATEAAPVDLWLTWFDDIYTRMLAREWRYMLFGTLALLWLFGGMIEFFSGGYTYSDASLSAVVHDSAIQENTSSSPSYIGKKVDAILNAHDQAEETTPNTSIPSHSAPAILPETWVK